MLDFLWRALGYKLEKDIIREHQLARAKKWFVAEALKITEALEKEEAAKNPPAVPPRSYSAVVIENKPTRRSKRAHAAANLCQIKREQCIDI